jgi:signal transduction histidine kinase
MTVQLGRTWFRLTGWYVGVFGVVLIALGAGLYVAVTREISRAVDRGLEVAVEQANRALEIREREMHIDSEHLVDALDELHVPGQDLYFFERNGTAIRPSQAPSWVADAGREALGGSNLVRTVSVDGHPWRLAARAFDVGNSRYAVVAVAEAFQVDRQYPALVRAFLIAGIASLVLVAVGGSLLARRSLVPVQQSMDRMRRFVADASHELRTPAAVLRSTVEVGLQRDRSAEEYAGILAAVRDESERIGRLVEGLLLLASADDGRLRIRRDRLFLDDVLADAAGAARALAADRGVSIRVGDFDEAPVTGDAVLLRQLLLIIFDNAVKFAPLGTAVEYSVYTRGELAVAAVRDHGPGIPEADLPHVFERFFRAGNQPNESGTGIGLSIASIIADAHDAQIRIDSKPGSGTTVAIELPLAGRAAVAD